VNVKDFYMMPKLLARADGFISKATGEAVKLTASGKIIYCYMLTKNEFFTEKLNSKHYEAQATIAKRGADNHLMSSPRSESRSWSGGFITSPLLAGW